MSQVGAWFAANQIRKTYLARVKGSFQKLFDKDAGDIPGVTRLDGSRLRVEGYIRCIDRKVGKYTFSAELAGEDAKAGCNQLPHGHENHHRAFEDAATEFEFVGMATEKESVVCFSVSWASCNQHGEGELFS
eukprot:Skav213517  [mRNA]  locus=scaffold656:136100:137107:+ [translate_table: standard]